MEVNAHVGGDVKGLADDLRHALGDVGAGHQGEGLPILSVGAEGGDGDSHVGG